ncbi:hypothetical protein [Microcoleus sp. EPA2]|uniref:hypothetical protein n=1 Tax=Microcoleus sp. EPA2 TaxID=2841654 RepID=UPI00312B3BFA
MALQSKTFSVQLLPAYVVNSVVEVIHFRNLTVQSDELVAIYLDQATGCVDLNSMNIGKVPDLTGDEADIEKSLALTKAESQSNKVGLRFLTRKNNTGDWTEIAEFILLNYGRKDYPDFRGRLGYPSRLLELNDAIGVQLIDYGDGLLWDKDLISLSFGCTIDVSKKNDLTELSARIASLELALEGKLINLPSNTLLGRNSVNNGTVEVISQTQFVEQVDLATVFAQHTNGDDHGNYLTNARADTRYVALTGTQTIGGAKTFTTTLTTNGAFSVSGTAGKCLFDHNGVSSARFQSWGPTPTSYGLYVFNQYYSDGAGGRNALICNENGTWNIGASTNTDTSLNTINGSVRATGFTTLGDNVGIKVKRLTGVTAATQGATITIAHGLTGDKIVGYLCKVIQGLNSAVGSDFDSGAPGYSYDCNHDGTSFIVYNHPTNSANILSKPFSILVFYTA